MLQPPLRARPRCASAATRRVAILSSLLAVYSTCLGIWYGSKLVYDEVRHIALMMAAYAYLEGFTNIIIIFTVLINNEKIIKGFLPKTLLVYLVCIGASFYSLITPIYGTIAPLWQALHLVGNAIHLLLFRGLVKEVWGEQLLSAPGTPLPTVAGSLERKPGRQSPPQPSGEEQFAGAGQGHAPAPPAPVHRGNPRAERSRPPRLLLRVTEEMARHSEKRGKDQQGNIEEENKRAPFATIAARISS